MTTISDHRQRPEISLDEHVRRTQVEFGEALSKRRSIYLDVNYWIILRSAAGRSPEAKGVELLRLLRAGVVAGTIFCPISESVFVELMKQSIPSSRLATAALIDELSLGATLIDQSTRIATEIAHFIHTGSGDYDLHPLERLVWCKLSYVLGMVHPTNTVFDQATETAIQKAFFDHMWTISLCKMVEQIGDVLPQWTDLTGVAANLNVDVAAHAASLRSFKQAYSAEVRGIVDLVGGVAVDVIESMARKAGVSPDGQRFEERSAFKNQLKNLLALALENGRARNALRTMHILASLHASHRWNKGRQFNGNDLIDFNHAAAALAYCNAFFTEKPLRTMVMQRHVALDRLNGCHVAATEDDAIAYLRALV